MGGSGRNESWSLLEPTGRHTRAHYTIFSPLAHVRNFPKVKNKEKKGPPIDFLKRTWHLDRKY